MKLFFNVSKCVKNSVLINKVKTKTSIEQELCFDEGCVSFFQAKHGKLCSFISSRRFLHLWQHSSKQRKRLKEETKLLPHQAEFS
jgi:hypothetical protein